MKNLIIRPIYTHTHTLLQKENKNTLRKSAKDEKSKRIKVDNLQAGPSDQSNIK